MLFRKQIEATCAYCQHGSPAERDSIVCIHKGVMQPWQKCRRFVYDPLRREPELPQSPKTGDLDGESFRL